MLTCAAHLLLLHPHNAIRNHGVPSGRQTRRCTPLGGDDGCTITFIEYLATPSGETVRLRCDQDIEQQQHSVSRRTLPQLNLQPLLHARDRRASTVVAARDAVRLEAHPGGETPMSLDSVGARAIHCLT
eukprot:6477795-Amphidinium_carterae.6